MKTVIKKYRPELDITALDDADRHEIAVNVAKIAPSSPLYSNASIQASVASLAKKDAALSQSNTTVTNDKKQLAVDTQIETTARSAFDGELANLATLTGTSATSVSDVASMSFTPYVRPPVATGAPPVPDGIDVKIPRKGHGSAEVMVQAPKGVKWQFVVQWSPNPSTATSWELLVGTGRSRTLTGASGTQMWVRAARVRGQSQSDWCTPILVTIP
jgi:hypothetical protein